jgi:hypothetical protein
MRQQHRHRQITDPINERFAADEDAKIVAI